jgi:hypothetical protein
MISPICQLWVEFLARISYPEIDKYPETFSQSRDLPAPNSYLAVPNSYRSALNSDLPAPNSDVSAPNSDLAGIKFGLTTNYIRSNRRRH